MAKNAVDKAPNATVEVEPREACGDALHNSLQAFRKLKTVNRALRNFSCEIGDVVLPDPHDGELDSLCGQLTEYEDRLERAINEAYASYLKILRSL